MRRKGLEPDDVEQIRRLLGWHRDLLERYQRLNEVVDTVALRLDSIEQSLVEWFEHTSQVVETRLQRIEELMLLEKAGRGQSIRANDLREDMQTEHDKDHLRKLLMQQIRNLQQYQAREAKYAGDAPVWLCNKIEETEASIAKIREELDAYT